MVNAQIRLVLQRLPKKLPGCQGSTQSTQGGRTPLVPLPLWRSVQRRGYPAMGPVPSHPEVSYMEPARARQHPGKCERSALLEEQRGGPEGGRPASHLPAPPLNLQLAWSVGGTRHVQSNQRNWLGVSSDSRTLGNGNSAKRGSVKDDLGDRLQLKTSSTEPERSKAGIIAITGKQKQTHSALRTHTTHKEPFQY